MTIIVACAVSYPYLSVALHVYVAVSEGTIPTSVSIFLASDIIYLLESENVTYTILRAAK